MPWRCDLLSSWRVVIGVAWLVLCGGAQAQLSNSSELSSTPQAHLVTYGQGSEVWEWFGHNALWLQDPSRGLNHTFSFGYFDIEQAGFYRRFILGDMQYFGTAVPAEQEFAFYRRANRSIRVQTLNLSAAEFRRLYELLTNAIEPYPRYYSYDYFLANCSTWLRDLLDQTLDGLLSNQLKTSPAADTFRSHTHAQTDRQPWAQLGLMTLLGPAVDQPITAWDEAFLPAVLAEQVATLHRGEGPLVVNDEWRYAPERALPVEANAGLWSTPLWGVLLAGLVLGASWRRHWLGIGVQAGVVVSLALAGLVLIGMWTLTAHEVVAHNPALAMLHPLWLGLVPGLALRWQARAWWGCLGVLALGSLVWAIGGLWPHQDVLICVLPVVLATLWVTRPNQRSDQPVGRASVDG